jgi:hypothetical protein
MGHVNPEHPSLRLLSLLIITGAFEVTDPRDKVYGILAVASDGVNLGLVPDCLKTTKAVYIEVARRILLETGSLDVLRCVETLKYDDRPRAEYQIGGLIEWSS